MNANSADRAGLAYSFLARRRCRIRDLAAVDESPVFEKVSEGEKIS
ncbi:hypothetical protein KCP69_15535 [Salmonella enterica subsp. enterica]|nr:hypothetical protein KCP69_15535 [Salmonella enterica subsp. enterica]